MPGDGVPPGGAPAAPTGDRLRVALDVTAVPERPVGAGHYILQLARGLSARPDIDLVLCSRSGDRDRWAPLVPEGNLVAEAPAARPFRLAWEQLRLGPLVAASGAAVHHGPHYTMPRRCPVPSVVTVHDLSFFDEPRWHERSKVLLFRRAITRAAREAAVVVCPSQVTADALRRWCRVDAEVVVVPHGVDAERFRPVEPQPGSDAARLAGARRTPGAATGRCWSSSGPSSRARTSPRWSGRFRRWPRSIPTPSWCWPAGPAGGRTTWRRPSMASGLGRRIVRTGYVGDEDVPALLRSATAVVYPSLYEGFGLPALEALACGAPLVTTRGTAMEEVAGASAVLVEPGDADDLAGALDAVLRGAGNDRAAAERRALGFEIVGRHTWDRSTDLHVAAYRRAHSVGVPSR